MISGVHSIIYSSNAEADRAFLRDVLQLTSVDVGRGWLIFGLPPSEIAVHPAAGDSMHELYLMCDDIKSFIAGMTKHKIRCSAVSDQGWGLLCKITLPGGGELGVYEPRHARPEAMEMPGSRNKKSTPAAAKKKEAKKITAKKGPGKK